MNKELLSLEDLAGKTGVAPERISDWIKAELLRPDGFTDGKAPLFAAGVDDRVTRLQKLADLGYGTEEILRSSRRSASPRTGEAQERVAKSRFLTVGNLAERSGVSPGRSSTGRTRASSSPTCGRRAVFRLYSESYVVLCQLIRDLQLFGYTLEEIKAISDDVRTLMTIEEEPEAFPAAEVEGGWPPCSRPSRRSSPR